MEAEIGNVSQEEIAEGLFDFDDCPQKVERVESLIQKPRTMLSLD